MCPMDINVHCSASNCVYIPTLHLHTCIILRTCIGSCMLLQGHSPGGGGGGGVPLGSEEPPPQTKKGPLECMKSTRMHKMVHHYCLAT